MEAPDIETSSADYASRFSGAAGRYLLSVQAASVQAVLAGITPGSALDVGGGHGQLVDLLAEGGWRVTVHGSSDECETNLRHVHGKRSGQFLKGNLLELPLPDRSFDLVIAVRLISHVEDWPRLVAELCRVASRTVVIDYPTKTALNALTPLLFGLKKSIEKNTRTYTSFTRRQLCDAFAEHGFLFCRESKQFALPMGLHRAAGGAAPLRWAEAVFRSTGVTAAGGSPGILRMDRAQGK